MTAIHFAVIKNKIENITFICYPRNRKPLANFSLPKERDYMKKFIALVLAFACLLGLAGCNSTPQGAQDMSQVIEAKCRQVDGNLLVVSIAKVYGEEVSNTTHATYNVNISEAEMEIDRSALESDDYPVWIIPTEAFDEDSQAIVAVKIGGYTN